MYVEDILFDATSALVQSRTFLFSILAQLAVFFS